MMRPEIKYLLQRIAEHTSNVNRALRMADHYEAQGVQDVATEYHRLAADEEKTAKALEKRLGELLSEKAGEQ